MATTTTSVVQLSPAEAGAERMERSQKDQRMDDLAQAKDKAQLTATTAMSVVHVGLLREILRVGPAGNVFYIPVLILLSLSLFLQILAGLLGLWVSQLRSYYAKYRDNVCDNMSCGVCCGCVKQQPEENGIKITGEMIHPGVLASSNRGGQVVSLGQREPSQIEMQQMGNPEERDKDAQYITSSDISAAVNDESSRFAFPPSRHASADQISEYSALAPGVRQDRATRVENPSPASLTAEPTRYPYRPFRPEPVRYQSVPAFYPSNFRRNVRRDNLQTDPKEQKAFPYKRKLAQKLVKTSDALLETEEEYADARVTLKHLDNEAELAQQELLQAQLQKEEADKRRVTLEVKSMDLSNKLGAVDKKLSKHRGVAPLKEIKIESTPIPNTRGRPPYMDGSQETKTFAPMEERGAPSDLQPEPSLTEQEESHLQDMYNALMNELQIHGIEFNSLNRELGNKASNIAMLEHKLSMLKEEKESQRNIQLDYEKLQERSRMLRRRAGDVQERRVMKVVSFWQHVINYILYFVFICNVFITGLGFVTDTSGAHENTGGVSPTP